MFSCAFLPQPSTSKHWKGVKRHSGRRSMTQWLRSWIRLPPLHPGSGIQSHCHKVEPKCPGMNLFSVFFLGTWHTRFWFFATPVCGRPLSSQIADFAVSGVANVPNEAVFRRHVAALSAFQKVHSFRLEMARMMTEMRYSGNGQLLDGWSLFQAAVSFR